jgi:hypothetical protein
VEVNMKDFTESDYRRNAPEVKPDTVRFNIFGDDGEQGSLADAQDVAREIAGLDRGITIVSVEPSHQGSFDVTLRGSQERLNFFLSHYGVPSDCADWS